MRESTIKKELTAEFTDKLVDEGMNPKQAEKQAAEMAAEKMKTLAALHNPDMVAGGKDVISDFGDRDINSRIGGQWKSDKVSQLHELDAAARAVPAHERVTIKMNAKLERCK